VNGELLEVGEVLVGGRVFAMVDVLCKGYSALVWMR
jgi:hypothetical protein